MIRNIILLSILFIYTFANAEGYLPGSSIIDKSIEYKKLSDQCINDIKATTEVDLSNYYNKQEVDDLISEAESKAGVFNLMKEKADNVDSLVPDIVLTTTNAGDLQTAIDSLTTGEVLEIQTNAVYSPVIISKSNITIKVKIGYAPKISGTYGLTLSDGIHDVIISGITFDNCYTGHSNFQGSCITFGTQGSKVQDIIFRNINFVNTQNGSAVMLSYHGEYNGAGDYYASDISETELSDKIAFINCYFYNANQETIEGGNLAIRAVKHLLVSGCKINGVGTNGRGISLQGCQKALIENNEVLNFNTNGGEGIKIDTIGTAQFVTNAIIRENKISNCIEGIDIDDVSGAYAYNNIISNCSDEGISVDDSTPYSLMVNNICYNNRRGIRLENGAVAELEKNSCYNNIENNYLIENGYSLPAGNLENPSGVFIKKAYQKIDDWNSDGTNSFELSFYPLGSVTVILNNTVYQNEGSDYTINGKTITFIGGTTNGYKYKFIYNY